MASDDTTIDIVLRGADAPGGQAQAGTPGAVRPGGDTSEPKGQAHSLLQDLFRTIANAIGIETPGQRVERLSETEDKLRQLRETDTPLKRFLRGEEPPELFKRRKEPTESHTTVQATTADLPPIKVKDSTVGSSPEIPPVGQATATAAKTMTEELPGIGSAADVAGAAETGTGALEAIGAGSMFGPEGLAVGVAIAALTYSFHKLADTVESLDAGLLNMASSLRRFSAPVAQAEAEANVRRIQMELQRGEKIGEGLADYVTSRSKLDMAIENLKTEFAQLYLPIMRRLVDLGTAAVDILGDILSWANTIVSVLKWPEEKISGLVNYLIGGLIDAFKEWWYGEKPIKKGRLETEVEDFLNYEKTWRRMFPNHKHPVNRRPVPRGGVF